ncbi:unnamed protein product [Rotaria sp. Silwood2]|nr:unnamed protein product [Rotaria sp. Silwood2]CAF2832801.1 unnamed protein product [Rotaria sp. Silwood2]CAF3870828.1 unnamed protein product [Rotaria sp. Silwood2]CAF4002096.1 unnamed protein product [Rotaria sp. Silwood2]
MFVPDKPIPAADAAYELKTQLISTRIYIVLLPVILGVLVIYKAEVFVITTVIIESPLYSTYLNLYKSYSESLSCPCTTIAIQQDQFINVDVRLHQVCSSDFISDRYFEFLSRSLLGNAIMTGQAHMELVASWCRFAKTTIINNMTSFYSLEWIACEVSSIDLLEKQVQSLVDWYTSSITSTFSHSLNINRVLISSNAIDTGFLTMASRVLRGGPPNIFVDVYMAVYANGTCSCGISTDCMEQVVIQDIFARFPPFPVPGLRIGCYIEEATLQSTLECYYNQACLENFHLNIHSTITFNATALDDSIAVHSQFNAISPISIIVAQMMVENWTVTTNHRAFFNNCKPAQCIYTYKDKEHMLIVITNIIEFIGGLTISLKILVPFFIKFVRSRFSRQQPVPIDGNSVTAYFLSGETLLS